MKEGAIHQYLIPTHHKPSEIPRENETHPQVNENHPQQREENPQDPQLQQDEEEAYDLDTNWAQSEETDPPPTQTTQGEKRDRAKNKRKETESENSEEEENEDNTDTDTIIVAENRPTKGKTKGGITLSSRNGEQLIPLRPNNPETPIGLWFETHQRKKPRHTTSNTPNKNPNTINSNYTFKTNKITQNGTNISYTINEKQWTNITKTLNEEHIFTGRTQPSTTAINKPSKTKPKNDMEGAKWGNEKNRGYLYKGPDDPDPDLSLSTAEWMPPTLGTDQAIRRGLFTNKPIKKRDEVLALWLSNRLECRFDPGSKPDGDII